MIGKVLTDREGGALIYGEFGTGKTTVMRRVYAELRDHPNTYTVGVIENAGHCPTEFQLAGTILECFGHKSHHSDRKGRFDQVKALLLDNYKQGRVSVLLIDEAQEMPARVLEGLRGIVELRDGRGENSPDHPICLTQDYPQTGLCQDLTQSTVEEPVTTDDGSRTLGDVALALHAGRGCGISLRSPSLAAPV